MEFYYLATGPYHWLKLHETHMQGQQFYLPAMKADGMTIQQPLIGMLEPIQMYRYVFPKECLPIVAKTLKADADNPLYSKLKTQLWAMRKMIGLKEAPKTGLPGITLPVSTQHLQIIPIGIKDDEVGIFEPNGMTQEKI